MRSYRVSVHRNDGFVATALFKEWPTAEQIAELLPGSPEPGQSSPVPFTVFMTSVTHEEINRALQNALGK